MQTSSALMSMETGLQLIDLKRHKKIKRHKKLSSMFSTAVTMPTILLRAVSIENCKTPESRNINRKTIT